jgi:hypothetical protein
MRPAHTTAVIKDTIALLTIAQTQTMCVEHQTALNICLFMMVLQLLLTAPKMPQIAHYHAEVKIQVLEIITVAAMSVITHAKVALLTRVITNTLCIQTITTQLMRNYLIIHHVNVKMEF